MGRGQQSQKGHITIVIFLFGCPIVLLSIRHLQQPVFLFHFLSIKWSKLSTVKTGPVLRVAIQ